MVATHLKKDVITHVTIMQYLLSKIVGKKKEGICFQLRVSQIVLKVLMEHC